VAEQLRLAVLAAYDRMLGLELEHLAVDGCTTKAPCSGEVAGRSLVDRGKQGLKRSVVTDAGGIPLGGVPAGANRRDDGLLAATLDTVSGRGAAGPAGGALDAGYDYQACRQVLAERAMVGQIACGACRRRSRPAAVGRWSAPTPGAPVRQAALVHRTLPGRGRVLAGTGQRRHGLRPAGPPRLDPVPLGQPSASPAVTAYWRRPKEFCAVG
jgi:hypothetical protein